MQPYVDPTRKTTSKKNGRRPQKKIKKWKTTSKKIKMKNNLHFFLTRMTTSKKMEDDLKNKWKMNQSTKINLIGCDTIVNSPSIIF